MNNYYCTAVFIFGAPMYMRELSRFEAAQMFTSMKDNKDVVYCQYGTSPSMIDNYVRKEK